MKDAVRESLSYWGLFGKMLQVKKEVEPKCIPFGGHKHQYFLYYEPKSVKSNTIIMWVHGGGWNAGKKTSLGLLELAGRMFFPASSLSQ